jgi:hypothetical protein
MEVAVKTGTQLCWVELVLLSPPLLQSQQVTFSQFLLRVSVEVQEQTHIALPVAWHTQLLPAMAADM